MRIVLFSTCFAVACQTETPSEQTEKEIEVETDQDSDGFLEADDCDDSNSQINPNAEETCDGIDNNCNGEIDEDVIRHFFPDADGDGFGASALRIQGCEQPEGYVEIARDCDDANANTHPQAEEVCDGEDNNCNDEIDENTTLSFYVDADFDGFGSSEMTEACALSPGLSENSGDCNDDDMMVHPQVNESCDGVDNNCDGAVDEGLLTDWYLDSDQDGWGDSSSVVTACQAPPDHVQRHEDCDDGNATAFPGAVEICDGIDNNCDGITDETGAIGEITSFTDYDGDGFGDNAGSSTGCSIPQGNVLQGNDCNDNEAAANPAMVELCDGIDNNCDGVADESGAYGEIISYADVDGDGFGDNATTVLSCSPPSGHVSLSGDCNDNDAAIGPDAIESCDSIDNNCDGDIDEPGSVGEIESFSDSDGDGFGDDSTVTLGCNVPLGNVLQGGDCNDADTLINPLQPEVCDGFDNNCNGQVDDGAGDTYYLDMDGDGYGLSTNPYVGCSPSANHVDQPDDCNDNDAGINPGSVELPYDGIDNDCDTATVDGETDLLLHMDGSGGVFVDSSGNDWPIVAVGGISQSTTESVFGGSSVLLDGVDDRLEVSGEWSLGVDDFTIDMWVWIHDHTDMGLITNESPITATEGWRFDLDLRGNSGAHGLNLVRDAVPVVRGPGGSGGSYPLQTWVHVAAVRDAGLITLYLNGSSVASGFSQADFENTPHVLRVGQRGTTGDWFKGHLDEVRIIRGLALWSSDFTPPQSATLGQGD